MAWLLIRAFSDDKSTAWQLGDIVEVRSEGFVEKHGWGKLEGLPRFYRVQITDVDADRIKNILERTIETDTGTMSKFGFPIMRFDKARDHKIDISILPVVIKDLLDSSGMAIVTKLQIRNYIKDHTGMIVDLDTLG